MFALHPILAADTVELARWPLNRVLLMNDSTFPWLILVPGRPDLRDLHDLDPADHGALMEEVGRASRALQAVYEPFKINVAALGNVVEQLHIHVIARFRNDPAWPGPIRGKGAPYEAAALAETAARIKAALA